MSDTFIPPAVSEAGAALRSSFTVPAVESALVALANSAGFELKFHAGRLPDHTDGVGITVVELPEPEEPYFGCREAVAVCTGRSADVGFSSLFSKLGSHFPIAGTTVGGICFRLIRQKDGCRFSETVHHGIRKQTAELTLFCEVDLTKSIFSTVTPDEGEGTSEMWAKLHPSVIETALANHLGIAPGPLPAESTGARLRVVNSLPLTDPEWRDFTLEIAVCGTGHTESAQELAALMSWFPSENFSSNGVLFNGVWQEGGMEFTPGTLWEQPCVLAKSNVTARVNTVGSQGAGSVASSESPNRNVSTFDPAALERALTERIADALALVIDRDICRGEFPPPGSGVMPVAAVRLTGVVSGNRNSTWRVQAQLRLRAPHRDDLFRRILAFDGLFPRYNETMGKFFLCAILKRDFNLNWREENGRNMIAADLVLELIL